MTTANLPTKYVTRQRNEFVQEFMQNWGAKTEGIEPGQYVRGIILGFESTEYPNSENIILRTIPSEPGEMQIRLRIFGCGSLMKQLHREQTAPFVNKIYNVGDCVQVTFQRSFIANKGMAMGKLIALFSIEELVGYQFNEEDYEDLQKYETEKVMKEPMRIIPQAPTAQQPKKGFQPGKVSAQPPQITGRYMDKKTAVEAQAVVEEDDGFDI